MFKFAKYFDKTFLNYRLKKSHAVHRFKLCFFLAGKSLFYNGSTLVSETRAKN